MRHGSRRGFKNYRLRQNRLHDFSLHIRQPKASSVEFERHPLVIDAEQMQQGGLEIMGIDRIYDGAIAEFIGFAVAASGVGDAAGYSDVKAVGVIVAAPCSW